jgi:hypothetical protein
MDEKSVEVAVEGAVMLGATAVMTGPGIGDGATARLVLEPDEVLGDAAALGPPGTGLTANALVDAAGDGVVPADAAAAAAAAAAITPAISMSGLDKRLGRGEPSRLKAMPAGCDCRTRCSGEADAASAAATDAAVMVVPPGLSTPTATGGEVIEDDAVEEEETAREAGGATGMGPKPSPTPPGAGGERRPGTGVISLSSDDVVRCAWMADGGPWLPVCGSEDGTGTLVAAALAKAAAPGETTPMTEDLRWRGMTGCCCC